MNVGILIVVSLILLVLGYRFYGSYVARSLGVDPSRPTPAVTRNDGVDFIPTRAPVLFGHHFASIAAAGPIVGPTLAVIYGFVPAWLWLVGGVIFIGAVHDLSSLYVSVREKGQSVAEVARSTLGRGGFLFYVAFALLLCILVCAAFLQLAAVALTSTSKLTDLGLPPGQTLLRTVTGPDGATRGVLRGIASTSVVIMTLLAPLVGWLLYRKKVRILVMSAVALLIAAGSAAIGFEFPLSVDARLWMGILAVYCAFAAYVPVWIVLQPRDFVNVHFLYLGLAAMVFGLAAAGLHGVRVDGPSFQLTPESFSAIGAVWPFLFVTIACGAVSGAHGLVCGGTSCKQVASEGHVKPIGYGGMLLEGVLGISVVLVILGGLGYARYHAVVWPEHGQGNAPLAFALGIGKTLEKGFGLPAVYGTLFGILLLEGFVITTIDTIIRLSRYLFEELWETLLPSPPAILRNRIVNSLLPAGAMTFLAFTNGYKAIWPIFGSANQLLAALTLIAVTAWLVREGRRFPFAAIPAAFMLVTTFASLILLFPGYVRRGQWALAVTDGLLFALALGVVGLTFRFFAAERRRRSLSLSSSPARP
jgi:carbon starvation protein